MATIWGRPKVELKLGIEMTEAEVRALNEVMSYPVETFLKTFYERMGQAYLEKYEDGIRSLWQSFPREVAVWLQRVNAARKAFEEENKPHAS